MMELYGEKGRSIPQKIFIYLSEILLLWLSYWILFEQGGAWCETHLHIQNATNATDRRTIIFIFSLITFLRITYTMSFLLNRKMQWEESISVTFAFALYFIGFSLFVLPIDATVGSLDYFAILLFVSGCILNSGGEILRDKWKKKPENSGKIYTGGFFKYSRHINYFGDLLWITAYAIITRNLWSFIIPVLLFCFFAFYNAPKLDKYLKGKYGAAYDEYAKKTKMLIPYIY